MKQFLLLFLTVTMGVAFADHSNSSEAARESSRASAPRRSLKLPDEETSILIGCEAKGKSLSNNGPMLEANADFTILLTKDHKGNLVMKGIQGRVVTSPKDINGRGSYIGDFNIKSLTENPDYDPKVYFGYAQFKNFKGVTPKESAESGMNGQFLLDKAHLKNETFDAKYIFQAGDHMGGTLHMKCSRADESGEE